MNLQAHVIEGLPHVEGVLNYLKPTAEKPRSCAVERPGGAVNPLYEPHTVRIHDMRAVAARMSLDREGFELVSHRSAVTDFTDEEQLRRIYYPEAERLVAEMTGGARVVIFDHAVRRRVPGKADREPDVPRQPSTRIHGDYSAGSGPSASATSWAGKRKSCSSTVSPL